MRQQISSFHVDSMRATTVIILSVWCASLAAAEKPVDRRLLLADIPLVQLQQERDFAKAFEAAQSNDAAAMRKELMNAASSRETRVRLLAWNVLRALGVQPEAEEAWVVRGVVMESHEHAVAVYEDRSVRWNGGVLDSPGGNKELARLMKTLLASAEPAMKSTRPMPHADTTPVAKDRVRMTVLTFAGFYVIEAHGSALDEQHVVTAPFRAATEILGIVGRDDR